MLGQHIDQQRVQQQLDRGNDADHPPVADQADTGHRHPHGDQRAGSCRNPRGISVASGSGREWASPASARRHRKGWRSGSGGSGVSAASLSMPRRRLRHARSAASPRCHGHRQMYGQQQDDRDGRRFADRTEKIGMPTSTVLDCAAENPITAASLGSRPSRLAKKPATGPANGQTPR